MSELGKLYKDGESIVELGEAGDCMFVVQSGTVEVIRQQGDQTIRLAELAEGEFFGEMALFEKEVRSATVRARGDVRILTVDKKNLLRRINEDPSLAFRMVQRMSKRIRDLNAELVRTKLGAEPSVPR